MASLRTVHVIPPNYGEFQSLYLDREAGWLRPNLTILSETGQVYFETNEAGLKGDPIDPSRKLAVIWGDSVVFGIGRGWPCLIDAMAPRYQFLNGGIEGDNYQAILQRAAKFNTEYSASLNVLMLGWHYLKMNTKYKSDLYEFLPRIPHPVLVTMPTALNPRMLDTDISDKLGPGNANTGFWFNGGEVYSVLRQHEYYEHIVERNTAVREAAARLGLPLIDLFAIFDTTELEDFRQDFFDVLHPRPLAYAKLAGAVYDGLKPVLEAT